MILQKIPTVQSAPFSLKKSEQEVANSAIKKNPCITPYCYIRFFTCLYVIICYIKNYNIAKSSILGTSIKLEKKWIRHIISGTDVKKYLFPEKRQLVIFPYDIIDGKPVLIDKKTFEAKSPNSLWYSRLPR